MAALAGDDLMQRRHAIPRNLSVIAHARFLLEAIGPDLRQYIVANSVEERPFSRDLRRWVDTSSKLENDYFGFGTDHDLEHSSGDVVVHHRVTGRRKSTYREPGEQACPPHRSRARSCGA